MVESSRREYEIGSLKEKKGGGESTIDEAQGVLRMALFTGLIEDTVSSHLVNGLLYHCS
jgi:hypothetical protein